MRRLLAPVLVLAALVLLALLFMTLPTRGAEPQQATAGESDWRTGADKCERAAN